MDILTQVLGRVSAVPPKRNYKLIGAAVAVAVFELAAMPGKAHGMTGSTYSIEYDNDTFAPSHGDMLVGQRDFIQFYKAFAEFDLTGLQAAGEVTLSFVLSNFYNTRPAFLTRPEGTISVDVYRQTANPSLLGPERQYERYPYFSPSVASVGSFRDSAGAVGNVIAFDVTSSFNQALIDGETALRFRVTSRRLGGQTGGFGAEMERLTNFSLDVGPTAKAQAFEQAAVSAVPEPETYALLLSGLAMLGVRRRTLRFR